VGWVGSGKRKGGKEKRGAYCQIVNERRGKGERRMGRIKTFCPEMRASRSKRKGGGEENFATCFRKSGGKKVVPRLAERSPPKGVRFAKQGRERERGPGNYLKAPHFSTSVREVGGGREKM